MNTAIMNGIDNLRVGKEDYFHVSVFYASYFIKEIENILSPCSYTCYRNTRGSLGELEIAWKHSPHGLLFPASISRSPKLLLVFL